MEDRGSIRDLEPRQPWRLCLEYPGHDVGKLGDVQSVETTFHQDLNGDGRVGPLTTASLASAIDFTDATANGETGHVDAHRGAADFLLL